MTTPSLWQTSGTKEKKNASILFTSPEQNTPASVRRRNSRGRKRTRYHPDWNMDIIWRTFAGARYRSLFENIRSTEFEPQKVSTQTRPSNVHPRGCLVRERPADTKQSVYYFPINSALDVFEGTIYAFFSTCWTIFFSPRCFFMGRTATRCCQLTPNWHSRGQILIAK